MKEIVVNPDKLQIEGFIWVDGEKWAVLCVYKVSDYLPTEAGGWIDPYDLEYYLCMKPDGRLQLIDTDRATFHKDTKEVRKWMKRLNKKRADLKKFEGNLFTKLLKDYNY